MKKLMILTALLVATGSASAATIYFPEKHVVCDKKAGYCVDSMGISMGLTELYLGQKSREKLSTSFRGSVANLREFTLSNGVYCDTRERQCYRDRYFPRTTEKKERGLTARLFGN